MSVGSASVVKVDGDGQQAEAPILLWVREGGIQGRVTQAPACGLGWLMPKGGSMLTETPECLTKEQYELIESKGWSVFKRYEWVPIERVDELDILASTEQEFEPWQQRVMDEKEELDIKIQKLKEFRESEVFVALDRYERDLLKCQQLHMEIYALILENRVKHFKEVEGGR